MKSLNNIIILLFYAAPIFAQPNLDFRSLGRQALSNREYTAAAYFFYADYLRDTIKENNGRLLGELDHPEEGRFDVQMKEASHMITDLWYDDKTKCVMGKLEVLDTPNGKILKELYYGGFSYDY